MRRKLNLYNKIAIQSDIFNQMAITSLFMQAAIPHF